MTATETTAGGGGSSSGGGSTSGGSGAGDGTVNNPIALSSGVPLTNLSGAEGSETFYSITVPAGASGLGLTVTTSGGTGDVDLDVESLTALSDTCTSVDTDNAELCSISNPSAGEYIVSLIGFEAYSGVNLTATAP